MAEQTPTESADSYYTYRVMVLCENCAKESVVKPPKGLRVREFPCSHCGCYTLVQKGEYAG